MPLPGSRLEDIQNEAQNEPVVSNNESSDDDMSRCDDKEFVEGQMKNVRFHSRSG